MPEARTTRNTPSSPLISLLVSTAPVASTPLSSHWLDHAVQTHTPVSPPHRPFYPIPTPLARSTLSLVRNISVRAPHSPARSLLPLALFYRPRHTAAPRSTPSKAQPLSCIVLPRRRRRRCSTCRVHGVFPGDAISLFSLFLFLWTSLA